MSSLIYSRSIKINDKIDVIIPTIGEIMSDEDAYYNMLSLLTAMPIDLMVQLDDMGIDFTTIDEYQLFVLIFSALVEHNTSLFFGDMDLKKFLPAENEQNGDIVFIDKDNDIVIDRGIQSQIANALRRIHGLEKNNRKPGNEEAKRYMIERARKKQKRLARQESSSEIENLIVAMVNTEEFKYDYEGVKNMSIYQFKESVRQIINKVDYKNKMIGVYTGNLPSKDLSQDEFNWLTHK